MTEFQMKLFKDKQGVYLLIKDQQVIYVGQSEDVYVRLHEHQYESGREFDKAFYVNNSWIEGMMSYTLELEMAFICRFQPIYNKIKFDSFENWFLSIPNYYGTTTSSMYKLIDDYEATVNYVYSHIIRMGLVQDEQ